jgi:hypothetical protein
MVLAMTMTLAGCSSTNEKLTISDAEEAGFERDQQQIYQMVGAEDGWSGTWAGTTVELYQYADAESAQQAAQEDSFKNAVQPGNVSGWVTFCQVRNLLMLSKGTVPCRKLKGLGGK